jgi:hypothetical protein
MNWGKSIIIVFVIFAGFIIFFVVKMMNTNTSGVPDKYYEKGLKYQETINEEEGAGQYGPEVFAQKGTVNFYFSKTAPDSGILEVIWPPDPEGNSKTRFIYKAGDTLSVRVKGTAGFRNAVLRFYAKQQEFQYQKRLWVE